MVSFLQPKQFLMLKFVGSEEIAFVQLKKGLLKYLVTKGEHRETVIEGKLNEASEIQLNGDFGSKTYPWKQKNGSNMFYEVVVDNAKILENNGNTQLYITARNIEDIKAILQKDPETERIERIRTEYTITINKLNATITDLETKLLAKDQEIATLTSQTNETKRNLIADYNKKLQEHTKEMEAVFESFSNTTLEIIKRTAEHSQKPLDELLEQFEMQRMADLQKNLDQFSEPTLDEEEEEEEEEFDEEEEEEEEEEFDEEEEEKQD